MYTEIKTDTYEGQKLFAEKIKKINEDFFEKKGRRKKFYVGTFGCQMNVRDSETIKGIFSDMGYTESYDEKDTDVIIYNTCCVRENAENKVYGNLGFLKNIKSGNPDLKIILCGCMMQQDTVIEKIKESYRHVDIIFGTFNVQRLPQLLLTNMETKQMIIDVWKEHAEIVEDLPAKRESPFKASVNIMYGCNNYCTYCIVPYVRGAERSREPGDILKEIKDLASDGVKEIMLLGQNVNSYGKTLDNKITFAELLKEVTKIEGIERIRFVTSHPKDCSDELIKTVKAEEKICNHFHLPFQSGSNEILKKMNRGYTKEKYLSHIEKLKKDNPDIGLTTDIIVGFPGETEEDFEETLDVVKKSGFSTAFTFIYSERTGTPAAKMPDKVPPEVVKNRFGRLLGVLNPLVYDFNKSFLGKTVKVLAEEVNPQNPELISGRNEQNTIVHFKADKSLIGKIVDVKIIDLKTFYLIGELIKE